MSRKIFKLTQDEVKEMFEYDEHTGVLKRNGKEAGSVDKSTGYIRVSIRNVLFYAHRLIFLYVHGYMPKELDHINRDRLDNRICNLRSVTRQENSFNHTLHKNNTSGHCGVHWYKKSKKWQASIKVEGKSKHLGLFKSIEEAVEARRLAKEDLLIIFNVK